MNAAAIATALTRTQAALEACHPATLRISGQDIAAARGNFRASLDLEIGGNMPGREINFRVRADALAAAGVSVVEEQRVTWLASANNPAQRVLRVKRITQGSDDGSLHLTCEDIAK